MGRGWYPAPHHRFSGFSYLPCDEARKIHALGSFIAKRLSQPGSLAAVLTFSTLLLLAGVYFITVTPEISEPFTRSLLERLLPLSIWITGIASQTLLFLIAPHLSQGMANLFSRSKIFLLSLFLFSAILLVWSWVVQVVLPLESQVRGWNSLGVPILETQIFLAWACGLGVLFCPDCHRAT